MPIVTYENNLYRLVKYICCCQTRGWRQLCWQTFLSIFGRPDQQV